MPTPNLAVGHDAIYVWPAYILSAVVLVALVLDSLLKARRWKRAAERPQDDEL